MRLVPAFLFAGSIFVVAACKHWPGVSEGDGPDNSPDPPVFGTCSGKPLPCESLSGVDCTANSGCRDFGSCTGTPSESGPLCGAELSVQGCNSIRGCLWASKCNGTPFGSCSATTQTACLVAKGCVFTPTGAGGASGAGGTSGSGGSENVACDTFGASCKANKECGCFLCVSSCPTCRSVCGVPCLSDFDCAGASDNAGTFTPFCVGAPTSTDTSYTGICASAR